ncbi:hypothetical protein RUM44_001916 [Polyplax serrata]|uniref:Lipid droplet-regulating VLDL assembly factor AUP1 n=1 Tax=Polyplax serrata TaxID=468196 RepID=A0ABR1ALE2_POLSC
MVTVRELFLENRFPSGWKQIPILIYLPVGLILATIRVFIGLQAILAASLLYKLSSIRSVVLRFMCVILGVIVVKENEEVEDESAKVIVSNHVSLLDHMAIHLLRNSFSISLSDLPSFFHHALNYMDVGNCQNQEALVRNVKNYLSADATIDVQAEMGITSGQKGLLRFSVWPCKLSCLIQPVAIKIWRPPLTDISPSVINTSWSSDIFWFLFVPFTVFKIKYIPVIKQEENESPEDMCKRLEKAIADELNITPTNFTVNDKVELEKRISSEMNFMKQPQARVPVDAGLVEMASRVKEVLSDVPLAVIYKDLAKTRSVDLTITNFLEGLVKYTPERNPPAVQLPINIVPEKRKSCLNEAAGSIGPTTGAAQASTSFDTSSKTFHKSAQERMISFQERKLRLIQSARQRYIEKHMLNVMNSG